MLSGVDTEQLIAFEHILSTVCIYGCLSICHRCLTCTLLGLCMLVAAMATGCNSHHVLRVASEQPLITIRSNMMSLAPETMQMIHAPDVCLQR